MSYASQIKALLAPPEKSLFLRLNTPTKIQDYLDTLPVNYELAAETYFSPREVIRHKTAHCMEGAVLAAAVLALHGEKPLLMDLQTADPDEDHVVALFQDNDRWGAISKTNHPILRYRDAVYKTPRELTMSYFHEYFLEENGKKTLRSYSAPFDLSKFAPEKWVTSGESLSWMVDALDWSTHFPIAHAKNLKSLRPASRVERKAIALTEWTPRGKRIV